MALTRQINLCLCGALLLSACTQLQEGTQEVAEGANQNVHQTEAAFKELFTYKPPKKTPKPIQQAYCYHVLQDIICYHDAMPGFEDRLVAYQGNIDTQAGETWRADVPPVPATVQQASAAPVAPVEAVSSAEAVSAPAPVSAASPAPQAPMPLTQTEEQKAQAEKSMAHFDQQKPVVVGSGPAVKGDSAPAQ